MAWYDIFKLWKFVRETDPYDRRRRRDFEIGGVMDASQIPNLRQDTGYGGGNRSTMIRLRDTTDFIELSSVTNRQSRLKEYDRLRLVPEIETALTVYADESCVVGSTPVATPFGFISIKELAETKKPDEEFLVYCYDFNQQDYTIGWAYHPRLVKKAKTVKVILDNGSQFVCTPDHRVLLRDARWINAGDLKKNDELMPFYRIKANPDLTKTKNKQFARVYTHKDGWKSERQFIEEWKTGEKTDEEVKISRIVRYIRSGLTTKQIADIFKQSWAALDEWLRNRGFSYNEFCTILTKYTDKRRVLHITEGKEEDVYDLSVKGHENFATDTTIFHNCQIGNNGHMFEIICNNPDIKKDAEELCFSHNGLNFDRRLWNITKNLYLKGDHFLELIIDVENPKRGILGIASLPSESMYRIETIKGKLLEFQQSNEGPDYQSLSKIDIATASQGEIQTATAIRFHPDQIVHMKIGDDRNTFYPYGVSLVEPARGPANNLKLMEESMLVYRLTRGTERLVFYIDVGNLPPFKAEGLISRLQDQLQKKKTYSNRAGSGASAVDERWTPPTIDDNIWIPTKNGSATRVDTLPASSILGEIDDARYFRDKLFIALNFPKYYMSQEDQSLTSKTLSSTNASVGRLVQRLQMSIADGILQIITRHLQLKGYPPELYEDLQVRLTSPGNAKEISDNEIWQIRYDRAMALKSAKFMSDFDILTRILKFESQEAKEIVARSTIQQFQEAKLALMLANPELAGIATSNDNKPEIGMDQAGPNPPLTGEPQGPGEGNPSETPPSPEGASPPLEGGATPLGQMGDGGQSGQSALDSYGTPPKTEGKPLPEPSLEDLKKYDLELMDSSKEMDEEEYDLSELD